MFLSCLCLLLSTKVVFDKEVDGKKSTVDWLVQKKGTLIEILGKAEGKTTEIFCDAKYMITKYVSELGKSGETFSVSRNKDKLIIEKKYGQDVKTETFEIGNKNWVQDFSFGLKSFFKSSDREYKFEIVNPKDLSVRTMIASKHDMDYKTYNGVKYRAQQVKITLEGFYKKFWKAELWYDTVSHNLLYYKANEGPSTPYTILTIKELKK